MDFKSFNPEQCYPTVTDELYAYVAERDRELCQVTGGPGGVLHHIKYKGQGGENKANNLIILSTDAHVGKDGEHSKPRDVEYYYSRVKANEKRFRRELV